MSAKSSLSSHPVTGPLPSVKLPPDSTSPWPHQARIAVVLTATLLAAPHVSSQDAVLLCATSLLLLHHGLLHRFLPWDLPVIGD